MPSVWCDTCSVAAAKWVAEVSAWLQCFVGNTVRECSVHTSFHGLARLPSSPHKRRRVSQMQSNSAHSLQSLCSNVFKIVSTYGLPEVVVQKCFKFLRPSGPQPLTMMRSDGVWCNAQDTHEAWKLHLSKQNGGSAVYDKAFHEKLCTCMHATLVALHGIVV